MVIGFWRDAYHGTYLMLPWIVHGSTDIWRFRKTFSIFQLCGDMESLGPSNLIFFQRMRWLYGGK